MSREYYIYCHTAPNGKRYIGQTCQKPEVRWGNGHGYKTQSYFNRAIKKYGWDNIKHVVLCSVSSKENADFLEQYFIERYDTLNRDHGYNRTKGGGGCLGMSPSEETRKLIAEGVKKNGYRGGPSKEARAKLSKERTGKGNPMYGQHHSKEARARIGNHNRGQKRPPEWKKNISDGRYASEKICRRAVCQFTDDGVLVAEYRSIVEAADAVGAAPPNIRKCCAHENWHAMGYLWRYQDSPETFPAQQMGLFY